MCTCVYGGLSASHWRGARGLKGATSARCQQPGRLESVSIVWAWVYVLTSDYHAGLPTSRVRSLAARYWSGCKQPEGLGVGYWRDRGDWESAAGRLVERPVGVWLCTGDGEARDPGTRYWRDPTAQSSYGEDP